MTRASVAGAVAVLLTACSERPPESASREYPDADSPGATLLVGRCGICHVAPQPSAHVAAAWPGVVNRMQARMRSRGYPLLADEEQAVLLEYLQAHAASGEN